jgi:hypothetical protein
MLVHSRREEWFNVDSEERTYHGHNSGSADCCGVWQ